MPSPQAVHSIISRLLSKAVINIVVIKNVKTVKTAFLILFGGEENLKNKNVNTQNNPNAITKVLLANRWKFLPIN